MMGVEPQYHDSLMINPEPPDISDAEDSEDESGDLLWSLDGEEGIARFLNHSWRFMDAYHEGLVGDAAAWAVHQQNGHRSVSERAMLSLEAVVQA
jgi:hypothetical protein